MNNPNNPQVPGANSVGLAIIAVLVTFTLFPWPTILLLIFFGLLISIAMGVWKIAQRP